MLFESPDPLWDARRSREIRRRFAAAAGGVALALLLAITAAAMLGAGQ